MATLIPQGDSFLDQQLTINSLAVVLTLVHRLSVLGQVEIELTTALQCCMEDLQIPTESPPELMTWRPALDQWQERVVQPRS